jgi:hypothetical protein
MIVGVFGEPRNRFLLDGALALVVFVPAVVVPLAVPSRADLPAWGQMLLGGIGALSLFAPRRVPLFVWAVSGLAALGLLVGHGTTGPADLAPRIALYTVATTTERRLSIGVGVVSLIGVVMTEAAETRSRASWLSFIFPGRPRSTGPGHGLIGMREGVALLAGTWTPLIAPTACSA